MENVQRFADETTVIAGIPVLTDEARIRRRLRAPEGTNGEDLVKDLVREANALAEPRCLYRTVYIDAKEEGSVHIEGIEFSSMILRKNLDAIERVFLYVATVGPALEKEASSCEDILKQYYLEQLADMVLEDIVAYLAKELAEQYATGKLSRMNPGSLKDWPLPEQEKLFSLCTAGLEYLGVHLTSSYLMLPRKSVSGILFPSETTFVSCSLCPRKRCPRRRTPYNGEELKRYGVESE